MTIEWGAKPPSRGPSVRSAARDGRSRRCTRRHIGMVLQHAVATLLTCCCSHSNDRRRDKCTAFCPSRGRWPLRSRSVMGAGALAVAQRWQQCPIRQLVTFAVHEPHANHCMCCSSALEGPRASHEKTPVGNALKTNTVHG